MLKHQLPPITVQVKPALLETLTFQHLSLCCIWIVPTAEARKCQVESLTCSQQEAISMHGSATYTCYIHVTYYYIHVLGIFSQATHERANCTFQKEVYKQGVFFLGIIHHFCNGQKQGCPEAIFNPLHI